MRLRRVLDGVSNQNKLVRKLDLSLQCLHCFAESRGIKTKHVSTVSMQAASCLGGIRSQHNCVYLEILLFDRQPRVWLGDEVHEIIRGVCDAAINAVIQHFEEQWHPRHHSLFVCLCWCNAMMALRGIAASPSIHNRSLTWCVAFVPPCRWN